MQEAQAHLRSGLGLGESQARDCSEQIEVCGFPLRDGFAQFSFRVFLVWARVI